MTEREKKRIDTRGDKIEMDRLWIILNSKKKIIGEQSAHTKKSRSFGGTKKNKE